MQILIKTDELGQPIYTEQRRIQIIPRPKDEFGLIAAGFCTDLYHLPFVDGYPQPWLTVYENKLELREP